MAKVKLKMGTCSSEDADGAVRACRREYQPAFPRCPLDSVDGPLVLAVRDDLDPLILLLLLPDHDLPVKAAARDYIPVARVRPADRPDGAGVRLEAAEFLRFVLLRDIEYLYHP